MSWPSFPNQSKAQLGSDNNVRANASNDRKLASLLGPRDDNGQTQPTTSPDLTNLMFAQVILKNPGPARPTAAVATSRGAAGVNPWQTTTLHNGDIAMEHASDAGNGHPYRANPAATATEGSANPNDIFKAIIARIEVLEADNIKLKEENAKLIDAVQDLQISATQPPSIRPNSAFNYQNHPPGPVAAPATTIAPNVGPVRAQPTPTPATTPAPTVAPVRVQPAPTPAASLASTVAPVRIQHAPVPATAPVPTVAPVRVQPDHAPATSLASTVAPVCVQPAPSPAQPVSPQPLSERKSAVPATQVAQRNGPVRFVLDKAPPDIDLTTLNGYTGSLNNTVKVEDTRILMNIPLACEMYLIDGSRGDPLIWQVQNKIRPAKFVMTHTKTKTGEKKTISDCLITGGDPALRIQAAKWMVDFRENEHFLQHVRTAAPLRRPGNENQNPLRPIAHSLGPRQWD
ncbi:hypothetical protein BJ878DRAFT_556891 [Calycina marina]|uniref:Uncharacterized protein n=1 Tax=Calycina marina TaxID=1763456 RepID=A0A9P7Z809_9HELO|nr:hypothetical protein BJ878DRAFT_556891 [Calycina marina]